MLFLIHTFSVDKCPQDADFVNIFGSDLQDVVAQYRKVCLVTRSKHSHIMKTCDLRGFPCVELQSRLDVDSLILAAVRSAVSSPCDGKFKTRERI